MRLWDSMYDDVMAVRILVTDTPQQEQALGSNDVNLVIFKHFGQ